MARYLLLPLPQLPIPITEQHRSLLQLVFILIGQEMLVGQAHHQASPMTQSDQLSQLQAAVAQTRSWRTNKQPSRLPSQKIRAPLSSLLMSRTQPTACPASAINFLTAAVGSIIMKQRSHRLSIPTTAAQPSQLLAGNSTTPLEIITTSLAL